MAQRGRRSAADREMTEFLRARSDADRLRTATDADRAYWRARYDEAWSDGFRFHVGYRHWISGEEARERYFALHEVPQVLIAEWNLERN